MTDYTMARSVSTVGGMQIPDHLPLLSDFFTNLHQKPPVCLTLSVDNAPALEAIIKAFPKFIPLRKLPLMEVDEAVALVLLLHQYGLVRVL